MAVASPPGQTSKMRPVGSKKCKIGKRFFFVNLAFFRDRKSDIEDLGFSIEDRTSKTWVFSIEDRDSKIWVWHQRSGMENLGFSIGDRISNIWALASK